MDCAGQRSSDPSSRGGSTAPSPAATWAFLLHLQEATGDSECHDDDADLPAALAAFDADDWDAESCSGAGDSDDGLSVELGAGRRLLSWESWIMESAINGVVLGGETACPPPSKEEDIIITAAAGNADSDRLFWEACIAHGY